jgi:hypothetical protein
MSLMRFKYKRMSLEVVSLEENHACTPKKPSMVEEKKNDRAYDYINLLLEQALMRQRYRMMETFPHIFQFLRIKIGASSSNNHFGDT